MTEASVDSSASGDMTTEPSSTTVNVEPAASYESNTAGAATSAWSEASQRTTTDLQEQDGAVGESNPNLATHRDRSWVFSGGVAGALRIGHAPFPMPGVAAFLTLDPIASWPFAPKFVVSGDWSWSPTSKQAEGSADFELGALSFDVCPSHFTWTNVRLDTCIGGSLGAFSATGVEARNAAGTVVRPIFGFGLTGLLYLDLSDHFALSLRVAPQLNLVRDEFEFGDRVFHRVPPVSILLYLGLVAR